MTPRLRPCTPAELQRVLQKLGFVLDRQRGSHKVFVRASDDCTIVIPWHAGDLKRGCAPCSAPWGSRSRSSWRCCEWEWQRGRRDAAAPVRRGDYSLASTTLI